MSPSTDASPGSDVPTAVPSLRCPGPLLVAVTGRIKTLVDAGNANIVLDLREVETINSSMIDALLAARQATGLEGGKTIFCGLNDKLAQLLKMVKLDKMFTIEPDARTALKNVAAVT